MLQFTKREIRHVIFNLNFLAGIFITFFILIVIAIMIYVPNSNTNGSLWSAISILVILVVFEFQQAFIAHDEKLRQDNLLKMILNDIYFLTKNGKHVGHLTYYKNCNTEKNWPHQQMRNLATEFYATNLKDELIGKSLLKLRHLLFHANDKINQLNNYRTPTLIYDYKEKKTKTAPHEFWTESVKRRYVSTAIADLDLLLQQIECEIKLIGIDLTKEEKELIDDLPTGLSF